MHDFDSLLVSEFGAERAFSLATRDSDPSSLLLSRCYVADLMHSLLHVCQYVSLMHKEGDLLINVGTFRRVKDRPKTFLEQCFTCPDLVLPEIEVEDISRLTLTAAASSGLIAELNNLRNEDTVERYDIGSLEDASHGVPPF